MPYFFFEGFLYDRIMKKGDCSHAKLRFVVCDILMNSLFIMLLCLFLIPKGIGTYIKVFLTVELICIPVMLFLAFLAWKVYSGDKH